MELRGQVLNLAIKWFVRDSGYIILIYVNRYKREKGKYN